MSNPFASTTIAAGYASSRPPLHQRIVERAAPHLPAAQTAVDVGCGAGLSTRAAATIAQHVIGLEPVEAMTSRAPDIAPGCDFLVAAAEQLPFTDGSINLITAAGSLNYVDVNAFFPEAARALTAYGVLLVYDFSAGRSFRSHPGLDDWFASFQKRYPPPPHEARPLDPAILANIHPLVRLAHSENFTLASPMTLRAYIEYMLTETNVAAALRRGEGESDIRAWCEATLSRVWPNGEQEIVFSGYFAVLSCNSTMR